jgi:hypothetical protein
MAVGDGVGVAFFAECFRCLRGAGVGVGSKIFLTFVPNDSSAGAASIAENNIAMARIHFMRMLVFKQAAARKRNPKFESGSQEPTRRKLGNYGKRYARNSKGCAAFLSELAPGELLY